MPLHLFAASPSQGNPTRLGCGKLPKPGCPAVSLTSKNPSPVTAISGDLGVVSLHGWQLLAPFQIFAQRKPTAAWTKSGRSVACPWGLYQTQINCGSPAAVSTPWSRLPKEGQQKEEDREDLRNRECCSVAYKFQELPIMFGHARHL